MQARVSEEVERRSAVDLASKKEALDQLTLSYKVRTRTSVCVPIFHVGNDFLVCSVSVGPLTTLLSVSPIES